MRASICFGILAAATGALWYLHDRGYPNGYDAGIFILAMMVVLIVFNDANSRRPRRIIRDGERVLYDSHQTVCEISGWKWDREEFCSHWLITGDTGVGKTSSGLNKLLISLTERYPRWGGLILDPKGVYWKTVETLLQAARTPDDLALLRVRSPHDPEGFMASRRFNLIGDLSVPTTTYAQMIVDTHAANQSGFGGSNENFFNQRALEHISKCFDLMRVLELPFNLRTAYRLLSDKTQLQEAITLLAQRPDAFDHLALVKHFEVFYLNLKSEGQSEGEIATIANFLAPYQHPAVADVFCSDQPDTLKMEDVDLGKKICLSMSEEYARERKYIFTILKLLFYQHGLRRLDLKARDEQAFWAKNLLVLVGEEFQDVVTASEGGMSDYAVSAKIREANVSLLVLTQSQTSLLPPHKNKDQAHVLTLNLRNRMIYRAADEECARRSADFIGKRKVQKRSRSTGNKGVQYTYQEVEEHKVKTWQLRKLPGFTPILLHAGKPGRHKRTALRPLTGREVTPLRHAQPSTN